MPSRTNIAAIIDAWHSVDKTQRWFTRRDKMHCDGRQFEVVHDWGGDCIADETMKVVDRFPTQEEASRLRERLDDEARAEAVLKLFTD